MRSLLLALAILVLLSSVPPVKSGPNAYINKFFNTCWRMKGSCRRVCSSKEIYHLLCDHTTVCCINKKELPVLVGK
ncbi:beta-defensin 135 [Erinaceus europaeus]|uniref:Beta-defensin n=1 Tax=Erinaceus europaeus TaxID=9365 RepID=A0A1S2ZCN5_ERIEU|nr:beta-defensin 135 [Erinaceus europaeus]